jgi:hypothetical protein
MTRPGVAVFLPTRNWLEEDEGAGGGVFWGVVSVAGTGAALVPGRVLVRLETVAGGSEG